GGVSHYFENHGRYSRQERILISRMLTAASSRILRIIMKEPGLTRGDLALHLGVAGPTVTRSVQSLIDEQLIQVKRDGRFTRYYPDGAVSRELTRENLLAFSPQNPGKHEVPCPR
ncbi:MAG: winged helix-turn-helix domain-containing protein, partial [Methanospirillum sp.]|uniref:winged helix-turn-helix domain-containing protein n=1 Tax=Methanospirillum sp. TaxID=45200 RepID=UPI0023738914